MGKRVEQESENTIELLRLANESTGTKDLIRNVTAFFQESSGCDAVGVRLREGDDYPYFETRGFSKEFVMSESRLCARDTSGLIMRDAAGNPVLECMCGNVISGRFDPSKPFFTPQGSFWTNSTTELLATTSEEDRQARTRNRCNGEGYESVALIPLRLGEERLGLVQFNALRKGAFSPEIIGMWERLAGHLAIALGKFRAEEELRESERRLRNSEEKYRDLVDNASVGIYKASLDGRFLYVNKALAAAFEFSSPEEMMSESVLSRYSDPDDRRTFLDNLKKHGRVSNFELETISKSGKPITLLLNSTLEGDTISGMALNITEQKKLEAQLRHSQKMEAIGTLTGGIAHDFNNILNAILGFGVLALDKAGKDHPAAEHLKEVLAAAERASALTRRLLAFGRKQNFVLRPVDVNEVVINLQKMLSRIIGEDVELVTEPAPGVFRVMADARQIEQVMMNLAANARDAMPGGGRLTIRTGFSEIDNDFISTHGYGNPGRYALISVTDTGPGMDEETQKKIFEPFFTTKGVGKGTGLGLAIAYGIVKSHGGFINVYSEEGKGAEFEILLPLIEESPGRGRTTGAEASLRGGTETILVAEDDAPLRKLSRIILESFGYTVITAADGEEATARFMESSDRISLVILDMIMPRKSGREVYEEIKKASPGIRVLFASGYTPDPLNRRELPEDGTDCIIKPVSPKDLLKKVREMLDR